MKKKLRAIVEDSHFFYLKTLLFYEKNIPKNKTLFLGIKSGAKGSKIELFWGRFSRISSKLIYCFSIGLGFKTLYCHSYLLLLSPH